MKNLLLIASGSGLGGILRYLAQQAAGRLYPGTFPLGTFLVNISGCLFIGIFYALLSKHSTHDKELGLLLVTGLCGGFTTFSSFSIENINLLRTGHTLFFMMYVAGSVVLGLAATWLGLYLAK